MAPRAFRLSVDWNAIYTRFLDRTVLGTAKQVGFSGIFYISGGLAILVSTLLDGYEDRTFYDTPADLLGVRLLGTVSVLLGVLILVLSRFIRSWMFEVSLLLGNVLIAWTVYLSHSPTMGLALAALFIYAIVDAVMYTSWAWYLSHLVVTLVLGALTMHEVGVPVSAMVLLLIVGLGLGTAAAWLSRYSAESEYDQLTQLHNRIGFDRQVRLRLERRNTLALLLVNVDTAAPRQSVGVTFSSLEHAIRTCAHVIRRTVRRQGVTAHYTEEEFAMVLDDCTVGQAEQVAEDLIRALAPVAVASIGITLRQPGDTEGTLIDRAWLALMEAKSGGGGQSQLYGDSMKSARELETALANGELRLTFQPLVRISDRTLKSFEALVRWTHPTRGEISPAQFVQQAEKTGAIHALGEWTLNEVCRTISEHEGAIQISVNASLPELQDPAYARKVVESAERWGIPHSSLIVEVTEALLDQDSETVITSLTHLRSQGFKIALDDFGSGYSSLRWLDSFPADLLKIDRVFVTPIVRPDQDVSVLRGIVFIARGLGMETIVEGVEDDVQLGVMQEIGIDYVQGYHFARPDSIEAGLATIAALTK